MTPPQGLLPTAWDPARLRGCSSQFTAVSQQVHSDNGAGRRRVEVVHEASWRFVVFSGKFCTRLMVDEDHELRVMKFDLLPHAHEVRYAALSLSCCPATLELRESLDRALLLPDTVQPPQNKAHTSDYVAPWPLFGLSRHSPGRWRPQWRKA